MTRSLSRALAPLALAAALGAAPAARADFTITLHTQDFATLGPGGAPFDATRLAATAGPGGLEAAAIFSLQGVDAVTVTQATLAFTGGPTPVPAGLDVFAYDTGGPRPVRPTDYASSVYAGLATPGADGTTGDFSGIFFQPGSIPAAEGALGLLLEVAFGPGATFTDVTLSLTATTPFGTPLVLGPPTAVPEPAALTLLAGGLVTTLAARRRRAKKRGRS